LVTALQVAAGAWPSASSAVPCWRRRNRETLAQRLGRGPRHL